MYFPSLSDFGSKAPEHRLIAALLKQDAEGAQAIAAGGILNQDCIDRFYDEAVTDNLPALIYERICQLGLSPTMQALVLSDGTSLLERIRHDVMMTALGYRKLDRLFLELVDMLGELGDHMVWLKGTSLGRTLYQDPMHRFAVDFDVAVETKTGQAVLECLMAQGFSPVLDDPGYCHQLGVGPLNSLADLFLVPHNNCEGCHNLTLQKDDWPEIELKFGPLDTGLVMKDIDRFFAQAQKVSWQGRTFLAPDPIDHLMIELVHFHKHRFGGWGWLYDTHLLANRLTEIPGAWDEFLTRCRHEGVSSSSWKGLCLAKNLLDTAVPAAILGQLRPWHRKVWDSKLCWMISSEFVWNCNSLPMLLLNSCFMGDCKRKLRVLAGSLLPDDLFLSRYYARDVKITWLNRWLVLLLHWLVLVLPGGAIRRTFGLALWRPLPWKTDEPTGVQISSSKKPPSSISSSS